jgi:Zn-dependent peptidase ImmA (M78 family)
MTTRASLKYLIDSFSSYDPFTICDQYDINLVYDNLGSVFGYYCFEGTRKFIVINSALDDEEKRLVCAHELGHALLHPELNAFYTVFPRGKYERQANDFAVNLLLMAAQEDYPDYDCYQLARVIGIPINLLESAQENIFVK